MKLASEQYIMMKRHHLNQKLSILRLNIYISQFPAPSIGTVFHVTGGISFLEPRIWNFLPEKFKSTIL